MAEEPSNTIPEVDMAIPPQNASDSSPDTNNDAQLTQSPTRVDPVEPQIRVPADDAPPPRLTTPPPPIEPQNVQGVLSKPTHLDVQSPTISISSVDDVVPQPKSSAVSIPIPPQNSVPINIGKDVTTAGMTGATSRFTLRLPLLGRPKIPLNQAVAVAQAEDIRNLDPATPVNIDPTTPSSTTTEEMQRPVIPAVPSNTSACQSE